MAETFICGFRTSSTDAQGKKSPPSGCTPGGYDYKQAFSDKPGNCTGIFDRQPKCSFFVNAAPLSEPIQTKTAAYNTCTVMV